MSSNEETATGWADIEADTAIVADDTARREAPALAWALDTVPDAGAPASDRRPLSRPLIALLSTVCLAAIALAAFVVGEHAHRTVAPPAAAPVIVMAPPPAPAAPPPPPAAIPEPTPAPPPPKPTLSEADAGYLAEIHDAGVPYRSGDADAIDSAHEICSALATRSVVAETASVQRALDWTWADSDALVAGAIAHYCPRYAPPA